MSESLRKAIRRLLGALYAPTRISQFAGVGFVGAGVDVVSLFLLVELTILGPVLAKVISWELSIIVIFVINEYWTFARYGPMGPRALGRRFVRSNLVRFGGFLVTLGVLAGLHYGVGMWYVLANVVGIGAGFFVNYAFESLYTWKVHRS
ncbi:GtrA family protein [Natrarchaeobaculum aegyptiacum]|uniref:Polysaccharide synthesis protein GtrA n=1 Tax=Natrarchaeobaculum aegyptiacum TaxID=745377 RepID=A0A2Z2HPH8_9EURY|nr:GtrA family protein [Natrarchaeobaculum aegyptiacum]ARS88929.1 polysaccharide synthesis protein GtrA [Natrarchaeobaculum aegyptiacum]